MLAEPANHVDRLRAGRLEVCLVCELRDHPQPLVDSSLRAARSKLPAKAGLIIRRWDPSEGPRHQKCKKWRGLDEMLEVVAQGDPDKENYWRRMYAEDHPEPAPFVYCYTCARIRSIVAYQRIGWLEPKPKPAKPKPSPRTAMERRLKKLELEAADLRERLRNLPGAD